MSGGGYAGDRSQQVAFEPRHPDAKMLQAITAERLKGG